MAVISSIEAGNRTLAAFRAATIVAVIVVGAGMAQAADSSDRVAPPSAADVAILRGLLALQHPSLRGGMAVPTNPSAAPAIPAVTTEPGQNRETGPATEGEACLSPEGTTACLSQVESSTIRLADDFRASLDRSMAAAGYGAQPL